MAARSYLATLFLFTKSDFKTVVAPQSVFAISIVLCTTAQQYDVTGALSFIIDPNLKLGSQGA